MKGLFLVAGMALCLCSCGSVCASGGNVTAERTIGLYEITYN